MTDPQGTPLAVIVSAAHEHDVNFILPLVYLSLPRIGGPLGRPRQYPATVRADSGYTSKDLLKIFKATGIEAEIPQRGHANAKGLGKKRWPVERALAWLKQYRRIGVRRERLAFVYESLLTLACALITHKRIIAKKF